MGVDLVAMAKAVGRDIAVSKASKLDRVDGDFVTVGERRTIVLLHGFLGHPSDMGAFAEAAVAAGHSVISPEYGPNVAVAGVEAGMVALLESVGEPCHVVGHSLGGVISVLAACQRPDLFATVTTVASPLGGAPLAVLPIVRMSALGAVKPKADTYDRLRGLSVPLFSVAAEYDPIVPVSSALALSDPNLSLRLPEGHMSVLFNAEAVAAVTDFQSSVEARLI